MSRVEPRQDLRAWLVVSFVGLCVVGTLLPVFAPSSAHGSQVVINTVLLALCAAAAIVVWRRPALSTLVWFVPVVMVPAFTAIELWDTRIAPVALLSVATLLAHQGSRWRQWSVMDVSLVALGVVLLGSGVFGTPPFLIAQGLGEWLLCAAAGRALMTSGRFRGDHIAMVGAVLGTLAALQMALRFDVSDVVAPSVSAEAWGGLQYRYGLVRAELTLGHSIALGAVLAITLAFALRSSSRRRAIATSGLIGIGILATQSRGALLAAVLVVAMTVLTDQRTDKLAVRRVLRVAIPVGVLAFPLFVYYFLLGGRDPYSEVSQGSEYRLGILASASKARLLGLANDGVKTATGQFDWGGAVSIDNTVLYLALYGGWLVAVAYLAPVAVAAWHARHSGWSATTISLVGQFVLIFTVAPITQYQSVLWFILGVAAGGMATAPLGQGRQPCVARDEDDALGAAVMQDMACVVVHHRHFPAVLDTVADIRRAGVLAKNIVVVDNSSDVTIAADLAAALEHTPLITVPNRGYGAAVNAGLDALETLGVSASLVLVSTHEVRIDPASVRELRDALLEHPSAAVAGPTLVSSDGAGVWSLGGETSLWLALPRHVTHLQRSSDVGESRRPVRREWLDGALCLYDRTVLADQRFREDFFLYFEEAELHFRIRSTGRTVLWVPEARASQATAGVPAWLLGRNLTLFMSLHGGVLGRRMATPWTLARRAVGAVLRRRDLGEVRSIARGWRSARLHGFDAPHQEPSAGSMPTESATSA